MRGKNAIAGNASAYFSFFRLITKDRKILVSPSGSSDMFVGLFSFRRSLSNEQSDDFVNFLPGSGGQDKPLAEGTNAFVMKACRQRCFPREKWNFYMLMAY